LNVDKDSSFEHPSGPRPYTCQSNPC